MSRHHDAGHLNADGELLSQYLRWYTNLALHKWLCNLERNDDERSNASSSNYSVGVGDIEDDGKVLYSVKQMHAHGGLGISAPAMSSKPSTLHPSVHTMVNDDNPWQPWGDHIVSIEIKCIVWH